MHLGFKSQRRKKESEGTAAFPHERHNKLAQNCCAVKLDVICLLNDTPKSRTWFSRETFSCVDIKFASYFLWIFASLITMILLPVIKQVEVPRKVSLCENLARLRHVSRKGGKLWYGGTESSITMYMQHWGERCAVNLFFFSFQVTWYYYHKLICSGNKNITKYFV